MQCFNTLHQENDQHDRQHRPNQFNYADVFTCKTQDKARLDTCWKEPRNKQQSCPNYWEIICGKLTQITKKDRYGYHFHWKTSNNLHIRLRERILNNRNLLDSPMFGVFDSIHCFYFFHLLFYSKTVKDRKSKRLNLIEIDLNLGAI